MTVATASNLKRENILEKVRKILDRAEGTNHQGEIDAALALASKLMTMHAIEQAEVDALKSDGREQIIERKVNVGASKSPLSNDKGRMAVIVSQNNRCKVWRSTDNIDGKSTYVLNIVGYESDVDFAEMLWTSLCLQMEQAHNKAKATKRDWINGRTFRSNFNAGFVQEASARLATMREEAMLEIEAEHGQGTALILADRTSEVERWLKAKQPRLRRGYSGKTNHDGHARQAGAEAGRRADYSAGKTKRIGARGLIGQ